MKKNIIKIALVALAVTAMPTTADAQLTNILKSASTVLNNQPAAQADTTSTTGSAGAAITNILGGLTGSSSTASAITSVVGNLLGTNKVTAQSLVGTWNYTGSCVAFESENVLSNLGGSVASSKIESKLNTALSKAGIKPGKMSITFNNDKTFAITVGKKNFPGTYTVSGSDLTLTFNIPQKSVKTNVKLTLGELQVAMKADKMLEIITAITTKASAFSTQMSTVSALLSTYKGMYLGLKFNK